MSISFRYTKLARGVQNYCVFEWQAVRSVQVVLDSGHLLELMSSIHAVQGNTE